MGARISIPSGLNITAWRHAMAGTGNEAMVDCLEFGWPIKYAADFLPEATLKNHQSALDYPTHVQEFLDKDCALGAMLGPFAQKPYKQWFQTSPLMMRLKKESLKCRVIIDLSFPEGRGVNAGIPKTAGECECNIHTSHDSRLGGHGGGGREGGRGCGKWISNELTVSCGLTREPTPSSASATMAAIMLTSAPRLGAGSVARPSGRYLKHSAARYAKKAISCWPTSTISGECRRPGSERQPRSALLTASAQNSDLR